MVTPISMDCTVSSLLDTRHNRVQHAAPRPEQYSDCWDNCWVSTSTSWRNRMFSYNNTAIKSSKMKDKKGPKSANCCSKFQSEVLRPFEQLRKWRTSRSHPGKQINQSNASVIGVYDKLDIHVDDGYCFICWDFRMC